MSYYICVSWMCTCTCTLLPLAMNVDNLLAPGLTQCYLHTTWTYTIGLII